MHCEHINYVTDVFDVHENREKARLHSATLSAFNWFGQ